MCKEKYRFRLGQALTLTEVNPLYSNSLNKEFELEPGQRFYREKLVGGSLTFQHDDYDFIYSKAFNHQFIIQIDKLLDDGSYQNEWFKGEFTRTDCKIDEDVKKIEVTPAPFDKYKKLVDARNKEFNLIELSPNVDQCKVYVQPIIQVYTPLSSVITNIYSGIQFEQPVADPNVNTNDLINIYKFNFNQLFRFIPGDSSVLSPDVSGEYNIDFESNNGQFQLITVGFEDVNFPADTDDPDGLAQSHFTVPNSDLTDDDFLSIWQASNGNQFEYIGTKTVSGQPVLTFRGLNGDSAPSTGTLTHVSGATNTANQTYTLYENGFYRFRWAMFWKNPPSPIVARYLFVAPIDEGLSQTISTTPVKRSALFSPLSGSTGQFRFFDESTYIRVLTTSDSFDGNTTEDIPENDIVSSHGRYTKVIGYNYTGCFMSDDNQIEVGKYGRISDDAANYSGNYFSKPVIASTGELIPLKISEWTEVSLWLIYTPALKAVQNAGNTSYVLNYVYKLSSIIKSFLKNIDSSLSYEEDDQYSEFFYSVNAIRGEIKTPMITSKLNVISRTVDKPSRNLKIRFADIENLLKDFYQCYWYIDDNKFRIEFEDYFNRGLTYTGQNVNADLTALLEPKSKKPWSYKDKKYEYEKSEMPERILHNWMDEVSLPFVGVPIEMISPTIQIGNFDERSLSVFTSDIDFIHSQNASVSPDGFAFIEAVTVEGQFETPFVEIEVDGDTFYLQNGYASMFWAAVTYWLYDLPASEVVLNYETQAALSVKKNKIQDIDYPSGQSPDVMKLVTSSLGTGNIKKMSVNLSSGSVKITLRHVTE